jgi:hypothetical protein
MCDNQHIIKYNVDFNRFAIQTGWDDSVLRHHYYSGLAEHIKDVIGQVGKPSTLTELKTLAHFIDARYWKRLHEKSRSDKSNQSSSNQMPSQSNKPQQRKQGSSSNDKTNKSASNSAKSAISNGLTKDGKLAQQE